MLTDSQWMFAILILFPAVAFLIYALMASAQRQDDAMFPDHDYDDDNNLPGV